MERSQQFYFTHCQRCNNNGCLYDVGFPCEHCAAHLDEPVDGCAASCVCLLEPTDDEVRTNSCKYFVPKKEEQ